MTSLWKYSTTLIDEHSHKTTLSYLIPADEVDIDTEFAAVHAVMLLVELALAAVTDANVYSERLTYLVSGDPTIPADADISDEAAVVCYLSGTGDPAKFHVVRIPAPIDAMFNADTVTVDITNQALQDYVAELSAGVVLSDGESINLDIQEGIASGLWRSVKKKAKPPLAS